MIKQVHVLAGVVAMLSLLAVGCGNYEGPAGAAPVANDDGGSGATGSIEVDGSSTVAPLTDAIAEEYQAEEPGITVNVGVSGTGGGFERFCNGEIDISDASRAIKEEEVAICEENGVEYVELHVGTDALTMVTHPDTAFLDCLTTEEVTTVFGEGSKAETWQDVNPSFPDSKLHIFAPDTDSGTYDFMVEDALGLEASRQDYNASADDNIIAQGVIGTPGSWGFFGFAYYQESGEQLKVIQYDGGDGCVAPSIETAQDGSYKLTRPLYIYVREDSLDLPHVQAFTTYYLDVVGDIITDVGYIAQPQDQLDAEKSELQAAIDG